MEMQWNNCIAGETKFWSGIESQRALYLFLGKYKHTIWFKNLENGELLMTDMTWFFDPAIKVHVGCINLDTLIPGESLLKDRHDMKWVYLMRIGNFILASKACTLSGIITAAVLVPPTTYTLWERVET